jgi:hypothetical protein
LDPNQLRTQVFPNLFAPTPQICGLVLVVCERSLYFKIVFARTFSPFWPGREPVAGQGCFFGAKCFVLPIWDFFILAFKIFILQMNPTEFFF